jgi:hypothetical protein
MLKAKRQGGRLMERNEQTHAGGTPNLEADATITDVPRSSPVTELPEKAIAVEAQSAAAAYTYTYTSGPFMLPSNTHSIDWQILNNDPEIQTVRVTVFKCNLGPKKTAEPPGPLEVTLDPGECTHNANAALGGFVYEIQVKCNSQRIFPYASAWPGATGDPLPGSVVKPAEFIRRMP